MANVLLVDDDNIFHFISSRTLEGMGLGLTCHSVFNGKEALEFIMKANPVPEIVLLDLDMPVMNGFEFLKAFKTNATLTEANIKIIVLSSSKNISDIQTVKSLGAHHYLAKPLDEDRFRLAISA